VSGIEVSVTCKSTTALDLRLCPLSLLPRLSSCVLRDCIILLYSYLLFARINNVAWSALTKSSTLAYATSRLTDHSSRHVTILHHIARLIQPMPSHLVSFRSIIILHSHQSLYLPSGLFRFPHQNSVCISHLHARDMLQPSWPILGIKS